MAQVQNWPNEEVVPFLGCGTRLAFLYVLLNGLAQTVQDDSLLRSISR